MAGFFRLNRKKKLVSTIHKDQPVAVAVIVHLLVLAGAYFGLRWDATQLTYLIGLLTPLLGLFVHMSTIPVSKVGPVPL